MRGSYEFSEERLATLRYAPKPLRAPMQWIYQTYGKDWSDEGDDHYGQHTEHEPEIRAALKTDFPELKEKHLKDLLSSQTWLTQRDILLLGRQLAQALGSKQQHDMNGYEAALKSTGIKLDPRANKQITTAVSWKNPEAEKVIKKVHKKGQAAPLYGRFDSSGRDASPRHPQSGPILEYKPDPDLRDHENDPQDILDSFLPYYRTATLNEVSDPNLVFDLFEKLRSVGIFQWQEVEQFAEVFFQKGKSNAAMTNICKPAVNRWKVRYSAALAKYKESKALFELTKKTEDAVLIANAENQLKDAQRDKDSLDVFKKDLGTFVRFYEFMSQIVDYNDKELEKLSLYSRALRPLLRESFEDDDPIDLSNVELSRYRLSKIRQQDLALSTADGETGLAGGEAAGSGRSKDKKEEALSAIIEQLNALFDTEALTEKDLVNYAYTIRDKMQENGSVMQQLANNTDEQAMLGDFPKALYEAILDSSEVHQNQKLQLIGDPKKGKKFARLIFDMLKLAS